jgi:hypothetical protein
MARHLRYSLSSFKFGISCMGTVRLDAPKPVNGGGGTAGAPESCGTSGRVGHFYKIDWNRNFINIFMEGRV